MLPQRHPLATYRRQLVAEGGSLSVVVNGDEIGLQLRCGEYTVLATSYDYFDGCNHWIYLLDREGMPVDQLSTPDQPGVIQDVAIVSPNEVAFGYFGTHDRWNLTVREHGFWSYTPATLLKRFNCFFLAKRRLEITCTKGKPWSLPAALNPSVERVAPNLSGTARTKE
jgi:hypothetical protein